MAKVEEWAFATLPGKAEDTGALDENVLSRVLEGMVHPQVEIRKIDPNHRYAQVVMEPLERGYGTTIGNAIRRVLLASLPGAAITRIRINGVLHEFSTIPGVREDTTDIILNLKQVRLRSYRPEPQLLRLEVAGPKEITAGDILAPAEVEILNPDLHIATIADGYTLTMEMTVETGRGYRPADLNKLPDQPIGVIAIDSIFSPVIMANFTVESARVGQVTDYDRLIIDVRTDGGLRADEAVGVAAQILIGHFAMLTELLNGIHDETPTTTRQETVATPQRRIEDTPIEELDLSARAYNCLRRSGLNTVGDLISKTESEMMKVRNLGKKSLEEVKKKLAEMGLSFAEPED